MATRKVLNAFKRDLSTMKEGEEFELIRKYDPLLWDALIWDEETGNTVRFRSLDFNEEYGLHIITSSRTIRLRYDSFLLIPSV